MNQQDQSRTTDEFPDWAETTGESVEAYAPKSAIPPAVFAVVALTEPIKHLREWSTRTAYGKLLLVLALPFHTMSLLVGVVLALFTLTLCLPRYGAEKIPEVQPRVYKDGVEK